MGISSSAYAFYGWDLSKAVEKRMDEHYEADHGECGEFDSWEWCETMTEGAPEGLTIKIITHYENPDAPPVAAILGDKVRADPWTIKRIGPAEIQIPPYAVVVKARKFLRGKGIELPNEAPALLMGVSVG